MQRGLLWELDETTTRRARALVWDAENGRFDFSTKYSDGEYIIGDLDEALEWRMKEVGRIVSELLITSRELGFDVSFEIRPVVAVAR